MNTTQELQVAYADFEAKGRAYNVACLEVKTWQEKRRIAGDEMEAAGLALMKKQAIEDQGAEIARLKADKAELLDALEKITERAEMVAKNITVEKRSKGVSQAKHVMHMAGHLEQHAKRAREVLTQVKEATDA